MAMQLGISGVIRKAFLSSPSAKNTFIQHMSLTKNATKIPPVAATGGQTSDLHVTSRKSYPAAKPLPLPDNVDDSELACFSPQRSRDISGSVISTKTDLGFRDRSSVASFDPHVASYDCRGALSLNSAMQSNVPEPFSSGGKCTHLNMPGGQWGQGHKYIAEDMQKIHYARVSRQGTRTLYSTSVVTTGSRAYCTSNKAGELSNKGGELSNKGGELSNKGGELSNKGSELSRTDKLKRAVKEYGTTVVVFHVGISLLSLGGCYLAVTSGVNLGGVTNSLGAGSEVAAEAGHFVIAYAVHKMFAPVRISITLASTPFIVRYLRKIGFLKVPKPGP